MKTLTCNTISNKEINVKVVPLRITMLLSLLILLLFGIHRQAGGVIISADTPSGFYKNEFYLTLKCNKTATIYYTIDGSEPDRDSEEYLTPILIKDRSLEPNVLSSNNGAAIINLYHIPDVDEYVPKGTVIRAVAYDDHGNKSEETVLTYYVGLDSNYHPDNIATLNIVTDSNNLFGESGIYVSGKIWEEAKATFDGKLMFAPANFTQEGREWEREAYIITVLPDGDSYVEKVSIGIHGDSTTRFNQKSFNLKNLEQDGYLHTFFNSKSLILRTGGHDLYSSQMKDVLCQRLIEGRDIRIQRAIPVQVFINGEYWGFYWLQERIDRYFVATEYGVRENGITVVKNTKVVDGNDKKYNQYDNILKWVESHDMAKHSNYDIVCNWIDINSYMDYISFEIYVQNLDSISNNVSMWKTDYLDSSNRYADGKWRWIIYDVDRACFDPTMDSFVENEARNAPLDDILFTNLLKNKTFRKQFKERFYDISDNDFNYTRVCNIIDGIVNEVENTVIASHVRFIGPDYEPKQYYQDIEDIKDFFYKRKVYAIEYLEKHVY